MIYLILLITSLIGTVVRIVIGEKECLQLGIIPSKKIPRVRIARRSIYKKPTHS
jgi:hypothetical protein